MAAPTLTIATGGTPLKVPAGTSGDPVTWNDVWDWDDGGGSSGGDGDVPIDGGGTAKVNTFMTEVVKDAMYRVLGNVDFGDGSTPSYFASESEMVYMVGYSPQVKANAILRIGAESNEYSGEGSFWKYTGGTTSRYFGNGGTVIIYGSILEYVTAETGFNRQSLTIKDSNIFGNGYHFQITGNMTTVNLSDVYFQNLNQLMIDKATSITNIHLENAINGIYINQTFTLEGLKVTNFISYDIVTWGASPKSKNPITNIISPWNRDDNSTITEQYTFNLHVRDKDFADLAGVSVDCEYANLVKGSDGKSYKCIQDHTAIDATHKPITGTDWGSFWELFEDEVNPVPQVGGDWNTGFAYKSGTTEFSTQTTDVDGNIPEQTIQFKKWVGTSETLEARTHKITMSKANYETLIDGDIYFDEKMKHYHKLLPALATSDVRDGTTFNDDRTGELDLPAVTDTEKNVVFDSGTKTGTYEAPIEANTKLGVTYGADGTEYTGTYAQNTVSGAIVTGSVTVGTVTGSSTAGTVIGE